jgi:RNA polymerase sigma-70 factor (ECF subfamily)
MLHAIGLDNALRLTPIPGSVRAFRASRPPTPLVAWPAVDEPRAVQIAPSTSGESAAARGPAPSRPSDEPGRLRAVSEPLADPELDELVLRSQRGDRVAFSQLFRRHRADVARLVFRMMGPTADAEDVIQEVFLQVHRSLGEFRGQAKFTTWLHRVTVNVVLMVRRAAKSRPVFSGEAPSEREPDAGIWPDEDASRRRRIDAFRRLLDRLAEKKRTVFVLHELEGLSPAEIAEVVGAPVLTVRTRLFYARRELAEMMRDEPALAQVAAELGSEAQRDSQAQGTEAT